MWPRSRRLSGSQPRQCASGGPGTQPKASPACATATRDHVSPNRLDEAAKAEILALRRQRLTGPVIARRLGRLALEPRPAIVRYQREQPGELIHIDIKKLGRIDGVGHRIIGDRRGRKRGRGWDFLHVCVDDTSRLAYTEILPDEGKESAVAFLGRALAWLAGLGVTVERVMTDNRPQNGRSDTAGACARGRTRGSAYVSHAFRDACRAAGRRRKRTRRYTPRTNGKAERFIRTSLREWAYLQAFTSSAERTEAMRPWLHGYNRWQPHSALGGKPPLSRLPGDNLHSNYT